MDVVVFPKTFAKKTNAVRSTKHSLGSFLPMRVLKELTKSFNIFFLFLCVIVTIPNLTSFSSSSYIMCIFMVISMNIVKTGVSEIKKYRLDRETNMQEFTAIRKGAIQKIRREDINPGDTVVIEGGNILPVNVLLLGVYSEKESKEHTYIETSFLNGESALKIRRPVLSIGASGGVSEEDISQIGKIKEIRIDRGQNKGVVLIEKEEKTFDKENVILKGSSVHGKCSIVGFSLGGKHENIVPRIKNSLFMKILSEKTLMLIFLYIGILSVASLSSCYFIVQSGWLRSVYQKDSLFRNAIKSFAGNILIFSSLVPLSLFVTLDGLRIAYSVYVQSDKKIGDSEKGCEIKTQGVVEDIGLITHVLSDKTGTLTKNQMVFKGVHMKGQKDPVFFEDQAVEEIFSKDYALLNVLGFLLCHSVEVDEEGEYHGASQEEVSILEFLKTKGICFLKRKDEKITVKFAEKHAEFRILHTMSFSPTLSRMGVVAEAGRRRFLLVKGSADTVNSEGSVPVDGRYRSLTFAASPVAQDALQSPAASASRSLEEYKAMSISDFLSGIGEGGRGGGGDTDGRDGRGDKDDRDNNDVRVDKDNKDVRDVRDDRDDRGAQYHPTEANRSNDSTDIIQKLEKTACYTGTVYIEDILQDNVKQTVDQIGKRGIRVWMVTGDRKESAISCGIATGIFENESKVISGKDAVELLSSTNSNGAKDLVKESAVIVYRATPSDKRKVAHLLRKSGSIVLGVGDGENDVEMIEESDIGVCVVGREGRHAAFVSDVVVPDFSSLSRLVTHHGPVCLERLKAVYLFYAFKSTVCAVCQCLYGVTAGSSGSIASSSLFLLFCNALITAPLSVEMGLFRTKSVVGSLFEAVLCGGLYGVSAFYITYRAFSPVDVFGVEGDTAGHRVVGRVFSLCLYVSMVVHFIFAADFFVAVSGITVFLSVVLFLVTLGLDGGFEIFLYPSLYLVCLFMITIGVAIERLTVLLRRKEESA